MNTIKWSRLALAYSKCVLLKKRIPLIVGWALTYRCNSNCLYCSLSKKGVKELTTDEVFKITDTLKKKGALRISLTGGEPLIREDIGRIIEHMRSLGSVEIKLNTNGKLVKKKIDDLAGVNIINISLDGPEKIHDALRGAGSFNGALEGAEAAKRNDAEVLFTAVITDINAPYLEHVLKIAAHFDAKVFFQPATSNVLGDKTVNKNAPREDALDKAISQLLSLKKAGVDGIANSRAGLLYLKPGEGKEIRCASGHISLRIEPNGDVIYCSREDFPFKALNIVRDGFDKAFSNLGDISCRRCLCGARVELNLAYNHNLSAITNQFRG